MKEYVCGACGYEYDPAVGDPDNGIQQEPHLRIFQKIGHVLSAAWARTFSKRNKS